MSQGKGKGVLFVCLGNICRSPLAEAVFAHLVNERGLADKITRIDSAGTGGYHVGSDPDERYAIHTERVHLWGAHLRLRSSVATCRKHDIPIDSKCRQLDVRPFFLLGFTCRWLTLVMVDACVQRTDFNEFDVIVGM